MFPCEMARYIARLAAEARKYGRFSRSVGIHVPAPGQRSPTQGHLGVPAGNFARIARQLHFNISERSAGISSQLPAGRPVAAAAQPCAAAVEAARGGGAAIRGGGGGAVLIACGAGRGGGGGGAARLGGSARRLDVGGGVALG